KLANHIDGTTAPSATITSGDQSIPNPAFTTWNDFDQRAVILLNSSLTEEVLLKIFILRVSLSHIYLKGTSTVSDYGRQFKGASFETFHCLRYDQTLLPTFRDLVISAEVMRCFSNLIHVSAHLLLLSFYFLNKEGVLDLHRGSLYNANKTTLEGGGRAE
ncbi:hypothetical protein Tco_0252159, partial [Tanacetum coccineum]